MVRPQRTEGARQKKRPRDPRRTVQEPRGSAPGGCGDSVLRLREVAEGAAILVVILLNAAIGFFTEIRAVRSMEALREIGQTTTRVRREGRLVEIPADQLVTGMWCSWRAGT